ncbi:MAG: ribonuclease III domain-containing protein [Bacilli bacterium]|nr:ribonuclease III domain-containing protein [Bacilli bacterium]
MDLFEEYLEKKDNENVKRALTVESYKNRDHSLKNKNVAPDLATLGDAIIKLCYTKYFLDKVEQLSKEVEKYVTDERFVTVIARHYDLLKHIHYDQIDTNIPQDYDYNKPGKTSGKNKKTSSYKYIATAVEAMIGAIYLETNDLDKISELLLKWKEFIDKTQ